MLIENTMITPTNVIVSINVQPSCWESLYENFCGGYVFGIASSSSAELVLASNPTWILIKWKMEVKIFKMRLIHFPSNL